MCDSSACVVTSNGDSVFDCLIASLTFVSLDPARVSLLFFKRLNTYGTICSVNLRMMALMITSEVSS